MIVFTDKTGQLANQLFEFSTFIANARENNTGLVHLFFNGYRQYFTGPVAENTLPGIKTSLGSPLADKVARKLLTLRATHTLASALKLLLHGSDNQPYDIHAVNSGGRILLKKGAWFTDFESFYKHQEAIKAYFSPVAEHANRVDAFIKQCRQKHDLLIGVHIRKGDYKDFLGGQFYFSQEVYADKVLQAARLFPGRNVGIVVCSNENTDPAWFSPLTAYPGPGHFIEDLYTLAECDYILGPPSTYSMWASFYGNKPLLKIRTADQVITREEFKIDYGY